MDRWLGSLAHAVNNIRTFVPADVILCGPIADYLDDSEIAQLERLTTCAEHVNPSARNPQVMRGCCVEYQTRWARRSRSSPPPTTAYRPTD